MYDNFTLKVLDKGKIQGYSWELENPEKVVCIIHGIGEHAGRYNRVAEKFKEAGIATLSMDLRGHGDTDGVRGHCAPRSAVLEDISELLVFASKKYPGKPIVLYGHSMGGNLALDYRARGTFNDMPEAYLITSPWVKLVKPLSGALIVVAKILSKVAPSMTTNSGCDEADLGHPDSVRPYNDDPKVHSKISFRCAVDGFTIGDALADGTNEDNGNAHDIPTMIMTGSEDKICAPQGSRMAYEKMKARGDKVELIEWPGLFHEIHNGNAEDRGDAVIDRIIEYIKTYQ